MSDINVFLEVRDSRIPFSSKNPEFDEIVKKYNKKKVIIMNKFDLCN
jgi:ribosome biogenesis GTPase A